MNADHLELAGIIAGSSVAGAVVTKLFERKGAKSGANLLDAEAAQVIANTAVILVAPLEGRIVELTTRVTSLEDENTRTKSKLQVAIDHILEVHRWIGERIPGHHPPQPPEELGL